MSKCKYDGTGVWAGRCTGTKEVEPCPGHERCDHYKPVCETNADRIRAMSDEELANWLECPYGVELELCRVKEDCHSCTLEWLRQPVEETERRSNNEKV